MFSFQQCNCFLENAIAGTVKLFGRCDAFFLMGKSYSPHQQRMHEQCFTYAVLIIH